MHPTSEENSTPPTVNAVAISQALQDLWIISQMHSENSLKQNKSATAEDITTKNEPPCAEQGGFCCYLYSLWTFCFLYDKILKTFLLF